MHSLTHTGEKPFHCTYHDCNKSFRQKGHLDSHMRRHTGEKPFTCTICHNQFKDKSGLNTHIRKHHHNDARAMQQLNNNNSDDKKSNKHSKQHSSRKFSTSTTSSDTTRSNSVSPNRQSRNSSKRNSNNNAIHNDTNTLKNDTTILTHTLPQYQQPIQPQYDNRPSLQLTQIPAPAQFNAYRSNSYQATTPTSEMLNLSTSSILNDSHTIGFISNNPTGGIVSQALEYNVPTNSMLLTSPSHYKYQTSDNQHLPVTSINHFI